MNGLSAPIHLKSHRGFLDHAITIAEEAERATKTPVFEPVEPLPASLKQPTPLAEAFSPHVDYKPSLLTSKDLLAEKKRTADRVFADQRDDAKDYEKAAGSREIPPEGPLAY